MTDSESTGAPSDSTRSTSSPKRRPVRPLPTDRIAFPKQLDLLRAYAVAHTSLGRPVTYNDVAPVINMSPATVALALPFWADVSLMERNDNGHTPSSAVMAFSRAHDWNSEAAPRKLAPVFRESWFGKALLPRLTFRAMDEREALELLADQATAGPDYKGQVRLLIEYLIAAGLAEREGNLIRAAKSEAPEEPGNGRLIEKEDRQPITKESGVVSPAPSINRVEFSVAISVDMAEIAGWEPARISAFFAGLAQVLAAKGKD